MLDKLVNEKPFIAVLFYARECSECEEAIQVSANCKSAINPLPPWVQAMEDLDEDCDALGIDFVKSECHMLIGQLTTSAIYCVSLHS